MKTKPKIWIEKDNRGKAKDAYWIYLQEKYGFKQSMAVTHEELVELHEVLGEWLRKER